ncbi:MAG: 4Fe-4S binding protein [Rhodoferax sp.]
MRNTVIPIQVVPSAVPANASMATPGALERLGLAMRRHRGAIQAIQWTVVGLYLALLIIPAFMPVPPQDASILTNLRLFAQFLFWGVWWPGVMVSTLLLGRVWCGVFCPEGTLTEFASRHGLGRPIARWLRWGGWPFVAFVCTTVYGQLVSVYEYPQAALLVLGGSSVAAVAIGWVYGRGSRVWCRYLCPANGVFRLLARVAPVHFRVDEARWQQALQQSGPRHHAVNCAPLINIRHMHSASACHACGRCAGENNAVALRLRVPTQEILDHHAPANTGDALTLLFGVIGVATAAFSWSVSRQFVHLKSMAAEWLIDHDQMALLQDNAPWWLLTHYPEVQDVFTWLDGLCILLWILVGGLALGALVGTPLLLAARVLRQRDRPWQRLADALIPIAGVSVVLGLSMLTLTHLKAEGVPLTWVPAARMALLALGAGFSGYTAWCLVGVTTASAWRVAVARLLMGCAIAAQVLVWVAILFGR